MLDSGSEDPLGLFKSKAISSLQQNEQVMDELATVGCAWGKIKAILMDLLPKHLDDLDSVAYHLVREFLDATYGDKGWHRFRHPQRGTTYVKGGPKPA